MTQAAHLTTFRLASVQAAYEFLDIEAGVEKAVKIIEEAARNHAHLVAFPEAWLPGFPLYIIMGPVGYTVSFFPRYYDNSIELGDKHTKKLQEAARKNQINVIMGYSQRINSTLYIAQMFIDNTGELVGNRRKIKPTHVERTLFGEGDGADVFTVDFPNLANVGAFSCWEHIQPLAKYAMYSLNEQIHVASWPALCVNEDMIYGLGVTATMAVSRTHAIEGQCFVLAATGILSPAHMEQMQLPPDQPVLSPGGGYATIFGPEGRQLTRNLPDTEEGLVYADVNLDMIKEAKNFGDPTGHYSRPDIFKLLWNKARLEHVVEVLPQQDVLR